MAKTPMKTQRMKTSFFILYRLEEQYSTLKTKLEESRKMMDEQISAKTRSTEELESNLYTKIVDQAKELEEREAMIKEERIKTTDRIKKYEE